MRDLCRKISAQISRKKSPFFFDVAKRPAFPQPPAALQKLGDKTSFGNSFWIYQNMFCFGTPRVLPKLVHQNFLFFGFFLSHEPKLLPKLASPIRDENSQNIAYRYKTYIRRNQKKRKKSFGRLQGSALVLLMNRGQ